MTALAELLRSKNRLASHGVAGPDTFLAMGLYELVLQSVGTRGSSVNFRLVAGADDSSDLQPKKQKTA